MPIEKTNGIKGHILSYDYNINIMKKTIVILLGIAMFWSCGNSSQKEIIPNFQEKELSFAHLKYGYDKNHKWIKNPENILMLHETFKKIGYQNIMTKEKWNSEWNPYLDIKKSPKNLVDSLILTFENTAESPKYYKEFWERRKKEENKDTVFQVIKEIQQIMLGESEISIKEQMVNDTLKQLVSFVIPKRKVQDEEARQHLEYLINIGLHESAYNLISGENMRYSNVTWKQDKTAVMDQLITSENNPKRPWFEDDTK